MARSATLWGTNVLAVPSLALLLVGNATVVMCVIGLAFNGVFMFLLLGEPLVLWTWFLFLANVGKKLLVVRPEILFKDLHTMQADLVLTRGTCALPAPLLAP